ncbi:YeeE/YedE family protein, partial [Xanthomonas perforans]|uniref:YeeE/YedE family protein n=1 Tax=Xanthomonas perforans TaxID=442694 RepID=UPI001F21C045
VVIVAGVLVGYGTRLGAGCTSGHGVSGLARLSPRSIVATTVFMLLGMATVTAVRAVAGAGA